MVILLYLGLKSRSTKVVIMWFDTILCFVLIPSSYLANTEVSKAYFLASAWYTSFIDKFRSNKVNPAINEKIGMGIIRNDAPQVVILPSRIPTISGSIKNFPSTS